VASTVTLVPGGIIVAVGIGLAVALQSAFHLALARILGPSDYSLLAAQLTIVLIATPAAAALQAAVAREVDWRMNMEGSAAAGLILRDTLWALARRGTALFVALLPLGAVAALLVDVRHPLPVVATIATIAGTLVFSLILGGLQGTRRFSQLSAAQFVFGGLKLCVGVALGLLGFAAGGVMLGVATAIWVTAAVSMRPLLEMWRQGRTLRSRPRRILRGFAGGPAFVLTLFAALSSMGVLVGRLSFTPSTAGAYAAVSFGAYSLLVIASMANSLLYPRIVTLRGGRNERRHLLGGLAAVAVFGAFGTVLLFAFPETILRLTFGSKYVFAAPWLGPLGIAMTLFALGNVYISHFLSMRQTQCTLLLAVLLVLQIALFALFHSAPGDLIGVLIATAALLVFCSELLDRNLRQHGRLDIGMPGGEPFVPLRAVEPIRDLADAGEKVTVVIPAYDEASRIDSTLRATAACMDEFGCSYEILVVDDGSRDATRECSERVAREIDGVRVVGYEDNAGKGHAIVEGARAARGGLVLFVDADLEVHPRQLQGLYEAMQEADADVVIGSKVHSDSEVDYAHERRLMSWGYYALVRFFFGLPVRDTQTGLKLFRKEVLDGVVPRMLVKRFAFDLEALVIAQRLGFRVVEAPVVVTRERDLPKVGWADALHTAWDTAAVWYRTYLRRYYDLSP
jgi:O-antigen/teichoic acid export membrane protein